MSLTSAAVDLTRGFETASVAWEEARAVWKDPVGRDFEATVMTPLDNQVRAVLQAMDRLTPILARALRDCA